MESHETLHAVQEIKDMLKEILNIMRSNNEEANVVTEPLFTDEDLTRINNKITAKPTKTIKTKETN